MQLHSLVISSDNRLGIGKLTALDNSQATVEYFCSAAKRFSTVLPLASLQWVKLPGQTRCYIHNRKTNQWIIGRIYEWDEENQLYYIDLPDSQTTYAPEMAIYVRCFQAIDDPIDILALKTHETPYFHNLRSRLMATLTKQRAISQGMTGLLSANIKLYPQQVATIRRILAAPTLRYLLANEVRRDSTIEAAVILRQFLLDDPAFTALVIVPPALVEQWQIELEEKIYLSEFGERVKIQSNEEQKLPQSCQLLLLDEADHIAHMATSANLMHQDYFERIKRLSQRCNCLLLLSDIPILNNEATFLSMLQLLDPASYSIEQLAEFKKIIKNRQEVGHLLLSLQSQDDDNFQKYISKLKTFFKKDKKLMALLDELKDGIEPEKNIAKLRTDISNIYRLHPRFLRSHLNPEERGKLDRHGMPKLEYDLDERAWDVLEQLEKWRTLAPDQEDYQAIFFLLYQGSSTWLDILQKLIETRLTGNVLGELREDFEPASLKKLTETKKFAQEVDILQKLLKILSNPSVDGDRLELLKILILYHLAEILQLQSFRGDLAKLTEIIRGRIQRPFATDKFPKLAIFSNFSLSAKAIIQMLSVTFGSGAVVSYCRGDSREKISKNLDRIKNDPQCFLLVCDRREEIDKNLHFINEIIHFDLPFYPQQLEQRFKKFASLSNKKMPKSWLLAGLDDPDSLEGAWYQLLYEGLNIFHRSSIPLEFCTNKKLPDLEKILFQSGAKGIIDNIPSFQAEIRQEELRIREQNILDEIDTFVESDPSYFQELEAYDNQDEVIEKAVEGWICNVLKFNRKYAENLYDVRSYHLTKRTLIPRHELQAFFTGSGFPAGVYSRRRANEYPQVHLYRLGEKLLEHLFNYLKWDERGQAFALWRVEENCEWVGFSFDYFIEADLTHVQPIIAASKLNEKAIKRRADILFPPRRETIFLDINFNPVTDEKLIKILSRPYHKSKDVSLAKSRLSILDQFIDPSQWERVCQEARRRSEQLLRLQNNFAELCRQQGEQAREKLEAGIYQLEQRLNYHPNAQLEEDLKLEIALGENLLKGIYHPHLEADAVGFMVVSGQESFARE